MLLVVRHADQHGEKEQQASVPTPDTCMRATLAAALPAPQTRARLPTSTHIEILHVRPTQPGPLAARDPSPSPRTARAPVTTFPDANLLSATLIPAGPCHWSARATAVASPATFLCITTQQLRPQPGAKPSRAQPCCIPPTAGTHSHSRSVSSDSLCSRCNVPWRIVCCLPSFFQ